jgi:hypothetical protein
MRALTALILSTSLLASSVAVAADNAGPLAPGKPAGVKQAELSSTEIVLIGFGVVAAIAIGVAASSNGSPVQPTNQLAVTTATV